jgi:hypothetical protein
LFTGVRSNGHKASFLVYPVISCCSGEQTVDELTFQFNGEGYAVLHRPSSGTYNKYTFSVSLKFRTLDENALLFLAVNPNVTVSSDALSTNTIQCKTVSFVMMKCDSYFGIAV